MQTQILCLRHTAGMFQAQISEFIYGLKVLCYMELSSIITKKRVGWVWIAFVNRDSFVCQVVCIVNSLSNYTSSMQCKTYTDQQQKFKKFISCNHQSDRLGERKCNWQQVQRRLITRLACFTCLIMSYEKCYMRSSMNNAAFIKLCK